MISARFVLIISLVSLIFLLSAATVLAFTSSSENYKLEGEFGIFGGAKTSANYRLTDTGGGFAVGFGTSSNYRSCSGFQCVIAQLPKITFTLSTNSVNLGTLTTGAVNHSSHTANVYTNFSGYSLTVVEDGNLRTAAGDDIDDVADGAVTAGSEEYGLATSKSGQDITQDTNCPNSPYNASAVTSTPKSVASFVGPTDSSGDTTTLCYAASRSGLTAAGSYNHILTYIATGTF